MKKEMDVTSEKMEEVIQKVGQALRLEAEVEHAETCAQYIEKSGKQLLDPESFNAMVSFDLEAMQELLVLNLLHGEQIVKELHYTDEQLYQLAFLYMNYEYMENHLDKLFEKYEGVPFSTDKTRYVLRLYRNQIVTGYPQAFSKDKTFWVPKMGSAEIWLAFTKSLPGLHGGDADEYLRTREALVKELEEALRAKKKAQHELLVSSPYFTKQEEREKKKGVLKQVYSLINGGEELEIHQKQNGEWGYILKVNGERYSRKEEEKGLFPEWVTELFRKLP